MIEALRGAAAVVALVVVGIVALKVATKRCWACGQALMRWVPVCYHCGRPDRRNNKRRRWPRS